MATPPARHGRIPIFDPSSEIDELWDEVTEAVHRVLRSGQFILGAEVEAFEREVAGYLGTRHAVGLNSGTDALVIGLRALGVRPGDEVIVPPFTFFATAESVSILGATPVFVDVELDTYNLDVSQVEAAVTSKTTAIVPVHLFGRPVDMNGLRAVAGRHGLAVLEDCAQSFGATVDGRQTGTLGTVGAFSFFPTKNLGAYGDGGLLVTDDDALADEARQLRAHGSLKKYHNETVGYNSRLDAIQAAVLRVKLPHIDAYNAGRRRVAERYRAALSEVDGLITPEIADGHVFHQYTVRVLGGRRDAVQKGLAERGIGTMVYYPVPCHRLPVYSTSKGTMPVSEQLAGEVLSLPIWPQLEENAQEAIVSPLRAVLSEAGA